MKRTIEKFDFVYEFRKIRPKAFSREGLAALYDYFEELEQETDDEIEFDPVAICCEFSEYDCLADVISDYDNNNIRSLEDLKDYTTVIRIPDTDRIIIQNF